MGSRSPIFDNIVWFCRNFVEKKWIFSESERADDQKFAFFFTLRAKKQKSPSSWYNSGAAGGGAGERLRAAGRATAGGTVKGHGH